MTTPINYSSDFQSFLEQSDLISKSDLQQAASVGLEKAIRLDRAILQLGMIEESELLAAFAKFLRLPFCANVSASDIDKATMDRLGRTFFVDRDVLPIVFGNSKVSVLTSDPGSDDLVQELTFFVDADLKLVVAPSYLISSLLGGLDQEISTASPSQPGDTQAITDDNHDVHLEGPAIKCLDRILASAVQQSASDVHIETTPTGYSVRLRRHGVLAPYRGPSEVTADALVARIKVLAGLNVAEKRRPQDGRIRHSVSGRKVEFRVSCVPTYAGESVVCRVLDPQALKLGWEKLGFSVDVQRQILTAIEKPTGLFLVTGPTGSGKTTTLYTALKHLQDGTRKIISVEDPVEYNLAGITQVQVRPEVGLTFASTLRAALRQDPDIIMVGEIRDNETAEVACRAALVGRLVLATLHASSAKAVVPRLENLGVDRFLIDEVLNGVLAQRLEAVTCEGCVGESCQKCGGTSVLGLQLVVEFAGQTSGSK